MVSQWFNLRLDSYRYFIKKNFNRKDCKFWISGISCWYSSYRFWGGHQDKLPALLAFPVNIYFSIFATTRNGLFQSLVFVSLGMYIADIEKSGELTKILHKGKIALFAYLIKIPISLIGGGQYLSQMLDLPIFFMLFCLIIYKCPKMELHGDFYKKLRNLSGTIYFVHMYFVALCALVLYKEDYHNFVSFFICAGSATLIAILFNYIRERKICKQ